MTDDAALPRQEEGGPVSLQPEALSDSVLGVAERERAVSEALSQGAIASAGAPALLAICLDQFLGAEHDLSFLVFAMIGLGCARLWVVVRGNELLKMRPKLWRAAFRVGALGTSATWGLGTAWVLPNLTSGEHLVLLMTGGIAAGATVSLAPDLALVVAYLVALLVPTCVGMLMDQQPYMAGGVISIAMFFGFMLIQARLLSRQFHSSLQAEFLLEKRATALEEQTRRADAACADAHRASEAKSSFLANISHELRSPLGAIMGYSELLLGTVTPEQRIDYAGIIRRNGDHLLSVLNDVLDLSKIEADKMTVPLHEVSLRGVLADVESLMRVRATERGLTLAVRADGPFPRNIQANATRLRQILLNLVGNAIKFTERGGVTIRIRAEPTQARLFLDVIDTGPGLAPEQQRSLFGAFAQVNEQLESVQRGTGLGLHISRSLARLMGGDLQVESALNEGSVFSLWLPLPASHETQLVTNVQSAARPIFSTAQVGANELEGLHILLAEDGADNRRWLVAVLSAAGARVSEAVDGLEAVSLVLSARDAGETHDVVLMDMEMPKLDGFGATAQLRSQGYRSPVVALTAHGMASHRARTKAAGCDAHLVKPIDKRALIDAIRTLVGLPTVTIDADDLRSALADDPVLGDLIPGFIESLSRIRERLRQAHADSDAEQLAWIAHELAGAGGSYGFDEITDAAREVEAASEQPDGNVTRAVGALVTVCDRAIATHRRAVATSTPARASC